MAFESFAESIKTQVNKVVELFTLVPGETSALMIDEPQKAMAFREASPVADCAVASSDSEVTTLKATATLDVFVDKREMVFWQRDEPDLPDDFDPDVDEEPPGPWYSESYHGQSPLLQPNTLVMSLWNKTMYYCDDYLRLTKVNLTTAAVPT